MGFGLSSLGSLVSSVGGFLGTSGGSALTQTVLNNYFNKKAASKQYAYTTSLRDYENEYNLPVNQRARLEEAGYNPNLALNGVNVQSASASAPQVRPAQIDLLQAYNLEAQNELLKKQMALTAKTEEKTEADTEKVNTQTEAQNIKNEKDRLDLKFYKETGVDPDSWQGNAFKPIWNSAQKVQDFAIRHLESPENDYFWNLRMQRARQEYNRRFQKK